MKRVTLAIKGMTCSSCEVLIERNLKTVPGVSDVKVSRAREEATLSCRDGTTLDQLQETVREKGYVFSYKDPIDKPPKAEFFVRNKKRYAEIGAVFLFIMAAYFVLQKFDFLPQSIGVTDNMSYGFIFLIGLVAATSTCLAVAGGLLLAVAAKFNEKHPHLTGRQKFRTHIYFNVGRIASYTILGGVTGWIGSMLTISPAITGTITIAASVLMVVMGIQLLQIFPWANKIQLKMPKFIAHKLYDSSHYGSQSWTTSLFGAATFFLPCGFTQALQLYVLGKGDVLSGALTMLAFSLGTLPALAGIGAFSSFAKGNTQRHFMTFSAILVIMLGIFNIPNGLALTGIMMPSPDSPAEQAGVANGKQVVEMSVNYLDYQPSSFTIKQGIPVEWRIDGRKAEGCAQVISVPSLGITEYLPRDQVKVITFTPEQAGQIQFSCTMGMAGPGVFTVLPNDQPAAPVQPAKAEECNPEIMNCNVQQISMEISQEKGFFPNVHVVKKGIPVEMEIDTKVRLGGCMGTMIIPKYGVAHTLSLGKSTLKFTPTEAGTFPFTCSMGSKMGEFVVI